MEQNYFYCYSIKLKDWFKLNGLQYVQRRIHSNGNYYWMFRKDEKLDQALKDWDKFKKVFG